MDKKQPPVAQLDRVSGYEPEGQEFESIQAGQFEKRWNEMLKSIEMRKNYMYTKGTFETITIDDVRPPAPGDSDYIDEENGQCCCGEYNCEQSYEHWTSGW